MQSMNFKKNKEATGNNGPTPPDQIRLMLGPKPQPPEPRDYLKKDELQKEAEKVLLNLLDTSKVLDRELYVPKFMKLGDSKNPPKQTIITFYVHGARVDIHESDNTAVIFGNKY